MLGQLFKFKSNKKNKYPNLEGENWKAIEKTEDNIRLMSKDTFEMIEVTENWIKENMKLSRS